MTGDGIDAGLADICWDGIGIPPESMPGIPGVGI
jgi:hypothetical protein